LAVVKKRNGRGGARPGSGPKPKTAAQRRRNRVVLNLTDGELARLRRAAGKEQLSTYMREIIFRHLARRKK